MAINVQSFGLNDRSTARIHRAGTAAIAGAIALALSLLGHDAARVMGIDGNIDTPGTLGFFLSYATLTVGWGLLFVGSLGFAWMAFRSGDRLLKAGVSLVSLGLGGTTLGFGFAALVGLVGRGDLAMIGELIGAPSMMLVFTIGSLVTGVALVRSKIVSRTIAWLMVATGPAMLLGALVVPVGIGLDLLLFAGPLCAAWILIGRELLATNTTTTEPDAVTA
ncbi:MAG: hypothetical protein IH933_05610 [Euryarchaeota archaeon]|nr:hypothetical protein [Euryarchaeota archaeon]